MSPQLELNIYELSVPNDPIKLPRKKLSDLKQQQDDMEKFGYHDSFLFYDKDNKPTHHFLVQPSCPEDYEIVDVPDELRTKALKRAIEKGFLQHLQMKGYEVRCGKFGCNVITKDSRVSIFPHVYAHYSGFRFQVFYFLKPYRVGLLCSAKLSQRFEISLDDELLAKFAINNYVVMKHDANCEGHIVNAENIRGRLLLQSVTNSMAVVVDGEGQTLKIPRSALTISCNKKSLLSYVEKSYADPAIRHKVSLDIDSHAKVLTEDRRVNSHALCDRREVVEKFLSLPDLRQFSLPAIGLPTARILERFRVEERL